MIKAEIVAHSLSPQGNELISVLCTFPRIILAEVNTHRMLSKNTSSSRAIPFNKMVEAVQENPFVPIAWQKEHKGMQGSEYITDSLEIFHNKGFWLQSRDNAVELAKILNVGQGVTKQLCNRLLEPFMWTTMLITGSKEGWDNFFNLRCPQYEVENYNNQKVIFKSKKEIVKFYNKGKMFTIFPSSDLDWLKLNKGQAEIHIMDLAEKIFDAMNESTPKQLESGEWHIPFKDKIEYNHGQLIGSEIWDINQETFIQFIDRQAVKVSTAMAARTSYTVVGDEKEINYQRMIELHDKLIAQNPPHSSPMEHCARAMSDEEYNSFIKGGINTVLNNGRLEYEVEDFQKGWCRNYKGFIQYRHIIENKI